MSVNRQMCLIRIWIRISGKSQVMNMSQTVGTLVTAISWDHLMGGRPIKVTWHREVTFF